MSHDTGQTSTFVELDQHECLEKLEGQHTGRVGWTYAGAQQILPVTYTMHLGSVVFRTSPYGSLSHLASRTSVAFEIDAVDEQSGEGWSVLVQGFSRGVKPPNELAALWAKPDLVPWAPGVRNLFIAIAAYSMTGRAVRAPFVA
jgi:nitroimidazol reductase NimA-like FMN-containing flavoprotein (pyridoxamine 5'-phosphate oxidase superfamily)